MKILNVLLTGATGAMGQAVINELSKDLDSFNISSIVLNSGKDKKIGKKLEKMGIEVYYGNLTDYEFVKKAVINKDIIVHMAAYVSPKADINPNLADKINFGGTKNIVDAIDELNQQNKTKLVNIGTIAEYGDRMPPIEYTRVGDPIKPSMFDYYAISKAKAERYVIESDLRYWASLRQTGIMGMAMASIKDPIIVHNPINNYLEYVSDRDSGKLIHNMLTRETNDELNKENFYHHIFNIGGGATCVADTREMYSNVFRRFGIDDLFKTIDPRLFATHNFHGVIYLDSDKLEDLFHFRSDSIDYFADCYVKKMGFLAKAGKILSKTKSGRKILENFAKKFFTKQAKRERGTYNFIKNNEKDKIDAFYGSSEELDNIKNLPFKKEIGKPIFINHGFDEEKDPQALTYNDLVNAMKFRGIKIISTKLENLDSKMQFECPFHHKFNSTPYSILFGGFSCPVCDSIGWNYGERAEKDPFFKQVWDPLHKRNEKRFYPNLINKKDSVAM